MRKVGLLADALIKYLLGLVMVGVLLFLPAGTLAYSNGLLFCGLLFIPMLVLGVFLFVKAPELLQKRLESREREAQQKWIIALSCLMFVGGFAAAGLDYRYGLTHVPKWLVAVASVIMLVAYGLYAEVMRENAYLSRTVRVQKGQKVISTGLYALVRHPMYMSSTLLFLAIPLVLGSWCAFVIFLIYPLLMVGRIRGEEALLENKLEGYREYKQKVKFRMIPFIW